MKKEYLIICSMLGCMATVPTVAQTQFTVSNSASFDRKGELVKAKITQSDAERIDRLALFDESGKVVPYQYLADKGRIAFLADVKKGQSVSYTLKSGTPSKAETRASAALMRPSSRNDIAWENARCAYRMYSRKLLSSEPNTANGVDLWVKKKAEPVIAKMYTYSNYHSEQAEGVDAYSVAGKTLGAGGNAAYVNGKLWLHDPFDECTITANGPLYSEFTLTYNRVEVDGDYYKKTVRISTTANGLLNKAVVKYEGRIKPMKIAAGILLHTNTAGVKYTSEANVIGYAENKSEGTVTSPNARFYEGIYMPGTTATATVDNQLIIYSDYAVGSEFTYYFGGGWNIFPAGEYKADTDWFAALKQFKQSEEKPLLQNAVATLPDKSQVLNAGIAANSYWIANHENPGNNLWARSVYNLGNIDFYKVYRDQQYYNYALKWAEANNWAVSGGASTTDADNHTCGQTYYDLYKLSGSKDANMIKAIKAALDNRIANNPKSDEWWWIDAMFMAMPTFARFESEYGNGIYSEKLNALYRNTRDSLVITSRKNLYPDDYRAKYGWGPIVKGYEKYCGLYSKADHLWWRDWGFQPNVPPKKDPNNSLKSDVPKKSPNGKNIYWSRGNGWVLAAMARTLQALPANDPHRADYIAVLKDMSAVLKDVQREDGFWNMNLADENHYPGPETSGTALFTYAMAWGINNGILDKATYQPVVAKAWNGLCTIALDPSGKLSKVQNVGESPIEPARLNSNVDFGVGAFLLASSEVSKLAEGSWPEAPEAPGVTAVKATVTAADKVEVTFDATLDATSAADASKYKIIATVAPEVKAATLIGDRTVSLTLSDKLDYGRFTLEINDVKSSAGTTTGEKATLAFVRTVDLGTIPLQSEIKITAIGNQTGNPPSNVMDGDLSTRWAQRGKSGQWILFDLGKTQEVSAVDISFMDGDKRKAYFGIASSTDGKTFTSQLTGLASSGLTNEMERYSFSKPQQARFVKIICNSNSLALTGAVSEHWNSVTEVRIVYPGAGKPSEADTVFQKIIDNVVEQELKGVNLSSVEANAKSYLGQLKTDGSFPDIDYNSKSQTNWPSITHLSRMHTVIVAYVSPKSKYYGDEASYNSVVKMLEYWYEKNPTSTNWYNWEIGWPQRMGVNLCLMRAGKSRVPAGLESNILNRMKQLSKGPAQSGSQGTGANKMDIALQWIYRTILQKDKANLDFAIEQFYLPLKFNSGEGLQADYSYLQHGRQLYMGGYGASVLTATFKVSFYLKGTEYSGGDSQNYINNFVKLSYVPTIRGQHMLYNVLGRGVARKGGDYKAGFASSLEKMIELDPSGKDFYEKGILRLKGEKPASYGLENYHRHFWRGDYSLHQRPGYTIDVRMASTRTARCENGNGENLKGYFMTEGGTQIVQRGDEYSGIFPVWDWSRIPGTTTPALSSVPQPAQWGQPGQSTFAGGVSDSIYGITTYDMVDNSNGINTRGKKSWFFFDKEVVCLGSGINSSNAAEINTTVNQSLLHGNVEVSLAGENGTQELSRGSHNFKDISWINHDSISYFFPNGGNVTVRADEQQGTWKSISTAEGDDAIIKKDVFKVWFNHGIKPDNAGYSYCIVPGTKDIAEGKAAIDQFVTLNNDTVQAVYNKTLNIFGAVFYKKGSLSLGDIKLSVTKPCVLMFKNTDTESVAAYASDPSCTTDSVTVYAKFPKLSYKAFGIDFDQRDFYKGSTTSLTIDKNTPDSVYIPVNSVSIAQNEASLGYASLTLSLDASLLPANATAPSVSYKSSDENVVMVDGEGHVYAVGGGKAIVSAVSTDGPSAQCEVTVDKTLRTAITTGDTYVWDRNAYKNKNYGTAKSVYFRTDGTGYNYRGYVKFPLSSLNGTDVSKEGAKVKVRLYYVNAYSNVAECKMRVFPVEDTSWDETKMTWNNRPANSTKLLAQGPCFVPTAGYSEKNFVEFDITDYALAQYKQGKAAIALYFDQDKAASKGKGLQEFASKENADDIKRPRLIVELPVAEKSFAIGASGYGTFFTDGAYVMPEGVEGSTAGFSGGKLVLNYEYKAGNVVPASTALLLKGGEGKYDYETSESDIAAPAGNLFHGTTEAADAASVFGPAEKYYYYRFYGDGMPDGAGFYWDRNSNDGGSFKLSQGEIFLSLDKFEFSPIKGFPFGSGLVTGLDQAIINGEKAERTYTLGGVLLRQGTTKGLPSGVYVKGGKKVLIK